MLQHLAERLTTGYMAVQLVDEVLDKGAKIYLPPGEQAPEGVAVERGPRGGHYYESRRPEPREEFGFSPNRPEQEAPTQDLGRLISNPSWGPVINMPLTHRELFQKLGTHNKLGREAGLVEQAWKKLPLAHFKGVKVVQLIDHDPVELAHYDRDDMSVSLAFRGSKVAKRVKQMSAIHEVGHGVFDGLWRPPGVSGPSSDAAMRLRRKVSQIYVKAVEAGGPDIMFGVMTGVITQQFVARAQAVHAISPYALTEVNEWWAENYAFYVMQPKKLKATNPEMYDVIRTVFNGKEY
jgi:hypothetical protein